MRIAEALLVLAGKEIASHMHVVEEYIGKLIAELHEHPINSISGRGVRVPEIELKKKNMPYKIAELEINDDHSRVDVHNKNGVIKYQSILTACIKSQKRQMPGQRRGDHSFYDIQLNRTALAFIKCYIAPHCKNFGSEFEDFKLIVSKLVDPLWLNNAIALDHVQMTDVEARELLDQEGYRFRLDKPLDLFLTEKGDELDQERALINEVFQDAYTIAKHLYEEAGTWTVKKREKANNILNHLRELSKTLKANPAEIELGLHRGLAFKVFATSRELSLYGVLNTHRILPQALAGETRSARLFRQRHMSPDSSSAETTFAQESPPSYSGKR